MGNATYDINGTIKYGNDKPNINKQVKVKINEEENTQVNEENKGLYKELNEDPQEDLNIEASVETEKITINDYKFGSDEKSSYRNQDFEALERKKRKSKSIHYDPTAEKVHFQIGMIFFVKVHNSRILYLNTHFRLGGIIGQLRMILGR